MFRPSRFKQRGIALLMAMVVVSIATVTAVSLVHEQAFTIRQTGNLQNYSNALMYGVGLEDYARLFLQQDAKDSKTDHLGEDWAVGIPALPIEGGFLTGQITDAQSLINLNSVLSSEQAQKNLISLCEQLEIEPVFIPALKDWLDNNQDPEFPDGAEDDYYTRLELPYRSANRLMADVSELRLVKGIDQEIYSALRPFITVLPEATAINLNTVNEQVYNSLGLELDYQKLVDAREEDAFVDLQDFEKRMTIALDDQQKTNLTVATKYFLAEGQVTIGDKSVYINSMIMRDDKGATTVMSRSLGGI
ncbi:MAG: type II secretion system minor pseudopilin GspK [Gammaproteobacteria bacterium]|nr:type II secretion system minor pseudopilin GspK [Gammaproteobacteria bacterium]